MIELAKWTARTEVYSWAITHNTHDQGSGEPGCFGGRDVHCYGLMISWNKTPGWVGNALAGNLSDRLKTLD
jgi:hypothetical protein